MPLPKKLKNMNTFVDGRSYAGQANEVTPPNLARKTEAYRGGGLGGAVHTDMGLDDDAMQMEFTIGGYEAELVKLQSRTTAGGVMLRFAGAFQADDTGQVTAVEIEVNGRIQQLDRGTYKHGDDSTTKATLNCVYYKETVNGQVVQEIDILGMVHVIDGVDILEEQRNALGL